LQYLTFTRPDIAYVVHFICMTLASSTWRPSSASCATSRVRSPTACSSTPPLQPPWSPTPTLTGLAAPILVVLRWIYVSTQPRLLVLQTATHGLSFQRRG
jgi:hypothetical protein